MCWARRGEGFVLGMRGRRGREELRTAAASKEGQRQRHSPSIGMRVVDIEVVDVWVL